MSDYRGFEETSPLFGANSVFIEQLQERYLNDPGSVDVDWRAFFASLGGAAVQQRAAWGAAPAAVIGAGDASAPKAQARTAPIPAADSAAGFAQTVDSTRAIMLIRAFRHRGHLVADLDPLKLDERTYHPELDPHTYGFTEADYDRPIFINGMLGRETATLNDILTILRKTYCDKIGVEFMHIQYPDQKLWVQQHIENINGTPSLSAEEKREILDNLIEVEAFEEFLQLKYPGVKRFSIQGGDAVIAGLQAALHTASEMGVRDIVIGMPHRGRMNVLTTVMGKPYAEMFSLFHGNMDFPESVDSSGDVKYHLGTSSDREMPDGRTLHLSLNANPSHLEVVNPVVCGRARAKQDQHADKKKDKVMAIQLHGDAAFAGQGSVPETLSLSELRGYRTGGSLHIIVNNQIGFTTSPKYSRFTPYPSDVAKMVEAPIFHVNGDDPEAVAYVCKLAVQFRQTFKRDVVVDVFCYRKYGHNEGDEPMYTQPLMYKKIKEKTSPAHIYAERLIREGVVSAEDVTQEFAEFRQFFEEQYEVAKDFKPNKANWLEGMWTGYQQPKGLAEMPTERTGVDKEFLQAVGAALCRYPSAFTVNKKLERILEARRVTIAEGRNIDWATAEALAYGSLLKEGFRVRLSGQDSGRGTFSQRHSVLSDQESGKRYTPLNHLGGEQGRYEVIDSSLSELAILGFEYGYSLTEPNALTLWEAQFGDFANGAQVVIDQFIASGEIKWLRMSGLVMLLPHGYEGQGPEHSSARIERYLQLCGEDNMQVVNCTTPANYFHVLRRQLHRKFRKPLVVMTPKSLLRHKLAVSTLEEMAPGTGFVRLYPEKEKLAADGRIRRVVVCSGKVYYDLYEERETQGIKDVAVLRLEQYYPFPKNELKHELARYKNAEVFWCQEEPENMGAWRFVGPRIGDVLEDLGRADLRIGYAGRKEAASPATGYLKVHNREQKELVETALLDRSKKRKVV